MPTEVSMTVRGIDSAIGELQRVEVGFGDPRMLALLNLAAGSVHRYLMGLGRDNPPIDETGVLPVITGRLKNSFFWGSGRQGGAPVGFVATNLIYAREVEQRRGMLARTLRDMERPVNDLFASYANRVVR